MSRNRGITEMVPKREAELVTHFNQPVLVEKRPIQVAKFRVSGDALHHCVFVHPRYAGKKSDVPYEIVSVRGYRRGRTMDLLLDEPIMVEGEKYEILNFKGVGADADRQMVIHPTLWFEIYDDTNPVSGRWMHRRLADDYARMWGSLREYDAMLEFRKRILPSLGIDSTPYLVRNDIPANLCKRISQAEGRKKWQRISQLVRVCHTNIRLSDFISEACLWEGDVRDAMDGEKAAAADAALANAQFLLAKKKEMLFLEGDVAGNRLIDGMFTDEENFSIRSFDLFGSVEILTHALHDMHCRLPEHMQKRYVEVLQERTGLCLSEMYWDIHLSDALRRIAKEAGAY